MPSCLTSFAWSPLAALLALSLALPIATHAQGLASGAASFGASPPLVSTNPDGVWVEMTMRARQGHSAVYDPVRRRMIVFGGFDNLTASSSRFLNDVWVVPMDGQPMWSTLAPSGAAPTPRAWQSAIYDPVRDRVLVFGGGDRNGLLANTVWALSLSGTPTWSALTTSGTAPVARAYHTAIYDPVRDRMIVFGGNVGGRETWALSLAGTPAWTQLPLLDASPDPRQRHAAIYDPVRDRMLVWGGQPLAGTVWSLSLSGSPAWSSIAPSGSAPTSRSDLAAIYDPVRDRMVVFGGGTRNDTWTLSLGASPAWTALAPAGTLPTARSYATAIYDPGADRMVVYGGLGVIAVLGDVQSLSLGDAPAWNSTLPANIGPGARDYARAILDPVRDRMLVFGGNRGVLNLFSDVWSLPLSGTPVWSALTATGTPPPERLQFSAIYDPVRDRMLVFGGFYFDVYNDVWALSLSGTPAWTLLAPSGTPPPARYAHSAIYDPVRDRMIVFGGATFSSSLDDVWALSLSGTPAWTPLVAAGVLQFRRDDHDAVYDPVRDRMLVVGGRGSGTGDPIVGALALDGSNGWTTVGDPSFPWFGLRAIHDPVRDRIVTIGGRDAMTTGHLEMALGLTGSPVWTVPVPDGTRPSERYAHCAIYDPARDRIVIYGGESAGSGGVTDYGDVWQQLLTDVLDVGPPAPPPGVSELRAPAPNPSRGVTTFAYAIARAGHVRLDVYDVTGRLVSRLVDGERLAGNAAVTWSGTSDAGVTQGTGVYFVRLVAPGVHATRRVVRLQ